MQQYIDEGAQFAAFRLGQSVGVGEIHPIVIRYAGDEPCIPIRLTRIAAQDDMDIRAFFLGDARVVPTNYRHVELNPVKLDWLGLGANDKDVVTMAVDSPMADGRAFVTEYAGPSAIVDPTGLFDAAWNAEAFVGLEPVMVPDVLRDQGLMTICDDSACAFPHPLVRGLMLSFLPPPEGVTEGAFWGDLAGHVDEIDLEAWTDPFEDGSSGAGGGSADAGTAGCGCRSEGRPGSAAVFAVSMLALGFRSSRRRRRSVDPRG